MTLGNDYAYDRASSNAYRSFDTDNVYDYDSGVMVLPVGSKTAATVTVRYHGGFGTRRVRFSTVKNGNPPVLPAPNDTAYDKLISAHISLPIPVPDHATNGFVWAAQGEYKYVTSGTPRIPGRDYFPIVPRPYAVPQDNVSAAAIQGTTLNTLANNIQSSDFQSGTYQWPFIIMPPVFFNSDLVY